MYRIGIIMACTLGFCCQCRAQSWSELEGGWKGEIKQPASFIFDVHLQEEAENSYRFELAFNGESLFNQTFTLDLEKEVQEIS